MGQTAFKRTVYDDLLDLPDNYVGEILAGILYASPRPALPHAGAASILGIDLGAPYMRGRGGPGGWWILDEPELHFGGDILVPDLAGWRRERMPAFPKGANTSLAPDWICEVLSPSTHRIDRGFKLGIYAREGVKHAWLVDPLERTLEVFRLGGEHWVLLKVYTDKDRVRVEPFEAVELELEALWGEFPEAGGGEADASTGKSETE